ncbi:MAG: cytochrome c-type biogenesis CcmF C-terminal domain-containing protein, partial [Bacillota bacterium]
AFLAGAAALAGLVREVRAHLRRSSPPRVWTWRRMGALLAHGGIAVMAVAILASTAFQVETSRSLALGESAHLAGYTVRFDGLDWRRVPGATEVYARVSLFRGDRFIRQLEPGRRVYDGNMAEFGATTEVALHRHPEGDVYVALAGWEENGRRAAFELYVNPLVSWLWIGSSLMLLGTVLALGCAAEARALERQARVRVLEQASRLSQAPSSGAALAQPTPGVR